MKNKIIFSNVHNYRIDDADCELLCLKAASAGIKKILLGPSSIAGVKKYINKYDLELYTTVGYPSGAFFPEQKSEETAELVAIYPEIHGFFAVSAVGRYLSGYKQETLKEMQAIKDNAKNRKVFYVIEASLFDENQMEEISGMAESAGIDGIVSTTGFKPYNVPFPSKEQLSMLASKANNRFLTIEGAGFGGEKVVMTALGNGADMVVVDNIDYFI